MRIILSAVTALILFFYWLFLHYLVDVGLVWVIPALIVLTFVAGWFLQTDEEVEQTKAFFANFWRARQ